MSDLTPYLLLSAFQLKHFLADFVFQNSFILSHRRIWGHPGGILHVAIHAALTLPILLIAGVGTSLTLLILLAELVFHYHLDWAKDGLVYRKGWTPADKQFWWMVGLDQALHQLSYIVIVAVIMMARS